MLDQLFPAIVPKISDRPQGAQELGLTDSLWEMIVRCWNEVPARRPSMTEVVGLLSKMMVSSFSMEADFRDFFEVCKSRGRDGQREKAQEFADELDEVRHTEMRITNSSHRNSRHLTTKTFTRKNGNNTYGTCKSCVAPLTFFRPHFCSHRNPSNQRPPPLIWAVTRACSGQPSRGALLRSRFSTLLLRRNERGYIE